jgi:hypothetical protein
MYSFRQASLRLEGNKDAKKDCCVATVGRKQDNAANKKNVPVWYAFNII